MADDSKDKTNQPDASPDPVADRSLSGPILVFSVLLLFSLGWALYDELVAERPWKSYQKDFIRLYVSYLKKVGPRQAQQEKAVRESPEFQKIERELKAAEDGVAPRLSEIQNELRGIRQKLAAIKSPFQDARAKIASLVYEMDHAGSEGGRNKIRAEIVTVKKGPFRISLPADGRAAAPQPSDLSFDNMEKLFTEWKAREAELTGELAQITAPTRELRSKRNDYLSDHLVGLSQQQIDGLLKKMENFPIEIRQIHVEEAGLVDRCESCHLGIEEPLALTAADFGGRQVFVSHPDKALLTIHDPSRFGCTPCHNGNGLATASAEKAHGDYEHWLWPMFAKENSEAGCLQCHFGDRVLDHAPVLTRGRDLFEERGCVGCHRYEGFDRETDALSDLRKEVQGLESRQKDMRLEMGLEIKRGDEAQSNVEAHDHYARAENLRVTASGIDARLQALDQKAGFLMQDQKMFGPNLKDVRLKLRKEWIPVWLKDPRAFRPGTKMPKFRLSDEEIRALSAFIWQDGLDGPALASQPKGDAAAGKELLETRGCLACHSVGEGAARLGGDFAANLSRVGEKANYDYIVRWVHNARERTRPYCPHEKRDLTPEDYARHGLPFQFDLENSQCPNDGYQLRVQNMTVMPSLRLSWQEARDIATYLMGLKHEAPYPKDVSFMDDKQLAEQGRQLVARYGCASCHEIRGLEDSPRIGTELTKEASKPMEQLDFGLLEPKAKHEHWYDHKGFFEHKLNNPAIYDQGRDKAPEDKLKMPNIELTKADVRALTTLLMGSLDSPSFGQFRIIPEQFRYIATDQREAIQEGWWVVKKYNCMGCHTVQVGQKSVLSTLPRYQDPDWKDQLPPSLVQEGARVNPEWLTRFLANPALSVSDTDRNGVRRYLKARMPTFSFSPNEIRKLVNFFQAMAGQPSPNIPQKLKPLDERELRMSRALFTSRGAPCLKCHLVGDSRHDRFATAPNFLAAKERLKPDWTRRWMLDPQAISPGTAMPSGLFRKEGDRWVFAGPTPEIFKGYSGDHVELLVRYMFELTAAEQQRLTGALSQAGAAPARAPAAQRGGGAQ